MRKHFSLTLTIKIPILNKMYHKLQAVFVHIHLYNLLKSLPKEPNLDNSLIKQNTDVAFPQNLPLPNQENQLRTASATRIPDHNNLLIIPLFR
jgi:hypothetical protein